MTKEIALTFDDGPWQPTTPRVLESLISRQIPATFMIWGEHAAKYPDLLKEEAASGLFAFGNHTFHHPSLVGKNEDFVREELTEADKIIQECTGQKPQFMRAPFGDVDSETLTFINRPVILWAVDTMSWDHHDPALCLEKAKAAQDGDIILMHDFQEAEAQALPAMLDFWQAAGFSFKTIPDLLGDQLNDEPYIYYSRDKRDKKGFA